MVQVRSPHPRGFVLLFAVFTGLIVFWVSAFKVGSIGEAAADQPSQPQPSSVSESHVTMSTTPTTTAPREIAGSSAGTSRPTANDLASKLTPRTTQPAPVTPAPQPSPAPASPHPTQPPVSPSPAPVRDLIDRCWPASLDMPRPELRYRPGTPGNNHVSGTYTPGVVTLDDDIETDVSRHTACGIVVHELAHQRQFLTYGDLDEAQRLLGSPNAMERNADCISQVLGYGSHAGGYGCDVVEDGRRVLHGERVDRRPALTPGSVQTATMKATTTNLFLHSPDARYGSCRKVTAPPQVEVFCGGDTNRGSVVFRRVPGQHGTFNITVETSSGVERIVQLTIEPAK